jgi:hypothetical protein
MDFMRKAGKYETRNYSAFLLSTFNVPFLCVSATRALIWPPIEERGYGEA